MLHWLILYFFFTATIQKNLSIRLEEVEANAVAGSKRIISKLEARIRDLELELEEEKRRHAETIKILRKKERTVKEVMVQCEEDQKNIILLQESLDKATAKINMFKRQLTEQVRKGFKFKSSAGPPTQWSTLFLLIQTIHTDHDNFF